MNRSLDELTASELNDAIDDTNFPKAQSTLCLSRPSSEESRPLTHQNGNSTPLIGNGNAEEPNASDRTDEQNDNGSGARNGHKGFMKRVHPAPLKMVAFKGDSIDIPGTPRTPRTSTTPGLLTVVI